MVTWLRYFSGDKMVKVPYKILHFFNLQTLTTYLHSCSRAEPSMENRETHAPSFEGNLECCNIK